MPRGMAMFSGDELRIMAVPQWLFDRNEVMKGAIVKAQVVSQQNASVVGGLVFFYDGLWLSSLGPLSAPEVIETSAGSQLVGQIIGRAGEAFVFRDKKGEVSNVPFNEITAINSPQAFTFDLTASGMRIDPTTSALLMDSNLLVFTAMQQRVFGLAPKSPRIPASNLSGTEPGITKKSLATFLVIDTLIEAAPAITVPLVLNKHNQRAAEKAVYNTLLRNGNFPEVPSAYNPLH